MPVHSQQALSQAVYDQSLEHLREQVSAIEQTSNQALSDAEFNAMLARGTTKGIAIAASFIPVVGNALSELTKSAAELATVDPALYEREKTKKIAEFIEHHKDHYQLSPEAVKTLLESAVDGLQKPADVHVYLHMELTKNLGALLLEGREHFDFKIEELQASLRLDREVKAAEKQQALQHQLTQSRYDGLGSAFGLLAGVGHQAKNSGLAKLGHIGQISVEIARAGNALKSAFSVGGLLTFLNPASAMGAGVLSLISLFGPSQPSESAVILKAIEGLATQLREFRFEAKAKLAEIDTHLLDFADTMTRHYLTLVEKLSMSEQYLHDFVKDRFNQLDTSIADLDSRQTEIGRLVLSQETRQLMHAVHSNAEDSAFFTGMSSDAYYRHLNSFTFWMSDASHHELHNGVLHLKTTPDATSLAIKHLAGKDPAQFLSILFYCLNAQLRKAEAFGVSKKITPFETILVNPFLWLQVTDAYLKLVLSAPQHFEDNSEVRRNSIHEADKLMDAVSRLQTSPMIYFALFELYQTHLSRVRAILSAEHQTLQAKLRLDPFADLQSQLNAYAGQARLPQEAQLTPQWAQFFSTAAIPLAGFQELILPHVPSCVALLCELKLGSLKLEVSVRDGQVGSYGRHLPHLSKDAAKHRNFSYAIDGFPQVRDYLYFERIFDFSVLFVPIQNQTQLIKVADVSLSSLLTQDRKGDGDKFRDMHTDLKKIKERLFFKESKKTGGRRYVVAGPRKHSKIILLDAPQQLALTVQAPMKRFITQTRNDAGLQSCCEILDQHLLSEKKKHQQKLENKMQAPGQELEACINQIRAIEVVLNACLEVAGLSAQPAVQAPMSQFFVAVPRLSEFQRVPERAFDALMLNQSLVLGREEQEQLKQDFERALLDPANARHPLETIFNESVDRLVGLPRVVSSI